MAATAHRPGARDSLDLTAAKDPHTSAGSLMVLAGNCPELRPVIMNNPSCSPELREWIARMPAAPAPGEEAPGGGARPGEVEDSLAPFGWEPSDPGLDEEPFGSVLGDPLMGSPLFDDPDEAAPSEGPDSTGASRPSSSASQGRGGRPPRAAGNRAPEGAVPAPRGGAGPSRGQAPIPPQAGALPPLPAPPAGPHAVVHPAMAAPVPQAAAPYPAPPHPGAPGWPPGTPPPLPAGPGGASLGALMEQQWGPAGVPAAGRGSGAIPAPGAGGPGGVVGPTVDAPRPRSAGHRNQTSGYGGMAAGVAIFLLVLLMRSCGG
ncbi:MAG: hypothetical protein Q4E00_02845 [Actinomyces bowdenii]|nr:hypothetical protein [Actinomyces bowdenii]